MAQKGVSAKIFQERVHEILEEENGVCMQAEIVDKLIESIMPGALRKSVAARLSAFLNRHHHTFERTPSQLGGNKVTLVTTQTVRVEPVDRSDWMELKSRLMDMARGMNVRHDMFPNHITALALMEIRDAMREMTWDRSPSLPESPE